MIVHEWIEENKNEILLTNKRLVSIRSQNLFPDGQELQVQLEIRRIMEEIGMSTDLFRPTDVDSILEHEAFLSGRNYEQRPNVVGTLTGEGGGRSIIFSSHSDTVPLGHDTWNVDPFGGEVIGDKQYGLGLFDMKGGLIASLMAVKCIKELGYKLKGDVMIESVVDEEFGGANGTLASRLRGYEADIAIIPEPSNLSICPVNQGGAYYRVSFAGRAGLSFSGEETINPIFACARMIDIVRQYHEWRNSSIETPVLYDWNPELVTLVHNLRGGNQTGLDLNDRSPSSCSFDLWIQCYPNMTEGELYRQFTDFVTPKIVSDPFLAQVPPTIEKKIRFLPGTGISEHHPILDILKITGKEVMGRDLPYHGAAFACDSFMFNLYSSTPAVILGPTGGNAHAPDEFIYINDFFKLIEIYCLTLISWCQLAE